MKTCDARDRTRPVEKKQYVCIAVFSFIHASLRAFDRCYLVRPSCVNVASVLVGWSVRLDRDSVSEGRPATPEVS